MKHSDESRKTNKINLLLLIPLFAQVVASVFFILALVRLNILQTWQLILVISIFVLFLALNAYLFFGHGRGKVAKTIGTIITLVIIAGSFFGSKYVRSATSFLTNVTGEHYSAQVYQVRALKDKDINSLEQLTNQKIGFISTNPNLAETKSALTEKLPEYEAVDYEEIGSMLNALYEQQIPAVVIGLSYLGFLEEVDPDFETNTIVLNEILITTKNAPDLHQPIDIVKEPFLVYISGSDSRGTINDAGCTDVNILAAINPKEGKILLVNVPRDYQVQIHGTTGLKDKLAHSGLYGLDVSKATIEDTLGIKIDYTIRVGFQAIQQLVNAIDGVDIDSDMEIVLGTQDRSKTCFISKGMNHLDGACTLSYARHRKTLKDGDLDRGKHQQQVLTAIINKVTSLHYVTRLPQILNAAKDTFQTSFSEKEITDFIRFQLSELKHWQIESIQIGTSEHVLEPTYTISTQNMWMYVRDEASENIAKQKIAEYLEQTFEPTTEESAEDTAEPEQAIPEEQ